MSIRYCTYVGWRDYVTQTFILPFIMRDIDDTHTHTSYHPKRRTLTRCGQTLSPRHRIRHQALQAGPVQMRPVHQLARVRLQLVLLTLRQILGHAGRCRSGYRETRRDSTAWHVRTRNGRIYLAVCS